MSPDDSYREIEDLFFRLESLSTDERQAALDAEYGDRPAIREKVKRLLAVDGREQDPIGGIVERAMIDHTEEPTDPGRQIGAFRLLELLGAGGMGEVYAAERVDGEYRQQVAIKWIKSGLTTEHAETRFRLERQVLAQLDHPHIARLLDGGSTPDGRPYLVMELIEGEPIDRYCDRFKLSIDARLKLFLKVCDAVRHAHTNLVIHRDIKPSNILVTPAGDPKLLDFGIAKLLQGDGWPGAGASAATEAGRLPMTPEYASPEQIREEPIGTATDVYALGLLLYRLLTGCPPYAFEGSSREQLRRAICETEVPKPSQSIASLDVEPAKSKAEARGISPLRWPSRLAGDLDAITLKALRKEPDQRYGSVDRLIMDVENHLSGLAVTARRGGWRYRAGRFLRRHKGWVAAVGATILALSVGLVGQVQETRRANREAAASAQVIELLEGVFSASDPYENRSDLSLQDVLDRGVVSIEAQLADQPLAQARLLDTMGRIFHNRGWFDKADPLFRSALERRQKLQTSEDPELASSHLGLADNLRVLGKSGEALPYYAEALEGRRRIFGESSLEVAEVENNLALAHRRLGNLDQAAQLLGSAIEIRRAHLGDGSYEVAKSMHNQMLIALERGEFSDALDLGRQTLDVKEKALDPTHPSIGITLFMMAAPATELELYPRAEQLLMEALDIFVPAWGENHKEVLAARGDLSFVRHLMGQQTLAAHERILAKKIEHLGESHHEVDYTLLRLSRQREDLGQIESAELDLRRALELRRTHLREGHPKLASSMGALGAFLLRHGSRAEAENLLVEAADIQRQALPAGHPDLGRTLFGLAKLQLLLDRSDDARASAQEAEAILTRRLPEGHSDREALNHLLASLDS